MKTCSRCGASKAEDQFYLDSRRGGSRAQCKVCVAETGRTYRHQNADKQRAYAAANAEKKRQASREWRRANPLRAIAARQAYYAANREKVRAKVRAYHAANPEKARALPRKRRARLRGLRCEPYRARDIFERDGWRCFLCGGPIEPGARRRAPGSASIDHKVPISAGGTDTPDNVVAAHLRCNISKGAKPLSEYWSALLG